MEIVDLFQCTFTKHRQKAQTIHTVEIIDDWCKIVFDQLIGMDKKQAHQEVQALIPLF